METFALLETLTEGDSYSQEKYLCLGQTFRDCIRRKVEIQMPLTSLYLKPLQLRIANVIAIGPKDKPRNYYPEIAVIEKETIAINPIIETKN